MAGLGAGTPFDAAVLQHRFLRVAREPVAGDGAHVLVQQAELQELADQEPQAARGVEVVHVRQPVRVDLGHHRNGVRDIGEVLRRQGDARRSCHGRQVQDEVGGPPRRHQADHAVDEAADPQHLARRGELVARGGDRQRPLGRGLGQGFPQRRARIDEAGARQVQAHDLHQHLVGVGGAVERAGAGAVIRRHLGRHQRVAADLAGGELLPDLRLLVVGQSRGHRARGNEDCGDVSERGGGDDEAGHDLVAHPEIERGVEAVVRHADRRGHRDHVAREERELHPRLALRHAIAHRRHAARDLRGGAVGAGDVADEVRVVLERAMGREHVVVGGDDAEVGGRAAGERGLVPFHSGVGMGLVRAGEVRADGPRVHRGLHAFEVVGPGRGGAVADAVGDAGNAVVEGHGRSSGTGRYGEPNARRARRVASHLTSSMRARQPPGRAVEAGFRAGRRAGMAPGWTRLQSPPPNRPTPPGGRCFG